MKNKAIKYIVTILMFILCISIANTVYAANKTNTSNKNETSSIISNESTSTLIELKEKEASSLENYVEIYGSESYGLTAYILHKVQIYSIPLCFLGIVVGAIHKYVIGIRHLESNERGLVIMFSFITLAIICQVLPLVFTIVVKFGRE